MANKFKRIGLWGRFSESSVAEPASQLAAHLLRRGVEVFAASGQGENVCIASMVSGIQGSKCCEHVAAGLAQTVVVRRDRSLELTIR